MKKILMFLIFTIFILPAYAGVGSFMDKCLNSWVGYSLDEVIKSWGYPTGEKEIAGKHLYYWNKSRVAYVPQTSNTYGNINANAYAYGNNAYTNGIYNSTTTTSGGYNVTYYCNKILEVDKNNKIVSWQWEGNRCPCAYFVGKKYVNPKNDEWARKKEEKIKEKSNK